MQDDFLNPGFPVLLFHQLIKPVQNIIVDVIVVVEEGATYVKRFQLDRERMVEKDGLLLRHDEDREMLQFLCVSKLVEDH